MSDLINRQDALKPFCTAPEKTYHLLLLKELHELGDINDEEYTALIRTLFSMVTDERGW